MRLFPKDRDLSQPVERADLRVRASDLNLPVDEVHIRLDAFLQRALPWRSRTSIQALIREGYVLIDPAVPERPDGGGELQPEHRPGRRLMHNSRVVVLIPEPLRIQRATSSATDLCVLYEDDVLIAVDKPPGLPVHPSGRHLSDTLIQRVYVHWNLGAARREDRIKLCHRLDKETSGVVLLARDPISHAAVMRQFEDRLVEKEYLAIVRGVPEQDEGVIDADLGSAPGSQVRLKMATVARGLPSRTDWRVIERYADCALVLCRLHTGRQHQIRVHMASIGHPLVGDKLYGVDEELFLRAQDGELTRRDQLELGLTRHALHAHRLALTSPKDGARIEITSPLPEDLSQYLAQRDPY